MKTTEAAHQLNTYLVTRRLHPDTFADHTALTKIVAECSSLLGAHASAAEPFMTAIHVMNNLGLQDQPGASLDSDHLLRACRDMLNLLTIDEVSGEAISVYADLLCLKDRNIDYTSYINVVTKLYVAAEALDDADKNAIRKSCADAFGTFRNAEIVSNDMEQSMDSRFTREVCQGLVKDLGFSAQNLQALKRLSRTTSAPQP